MPRKYPLSEREAAVCQRLADVRAHLRLPRSTFAQAVGLPVKSYTNYESKTVAVPFYVGRAVCRTFDVNQRWLATGKPPMWMYAEVGDENEDAIHPKSLFTEAYDDHLSRPVSEVLALYASVLMIRPDDLDDSDMAWLQLDGAPKSSAETMERILSLGIGGMIQFIPARLRVTFVRRICETMEKFKVEHAGEIDAWWDKFNEEFEAEQKSIVDINTHSADTPDVRLTWKELKNRLKKVTADRGQKAAAAKFIGVDRSNLNRWLDDDQEPGAEATFRLLEWVTAEEAKSNGPTSALTPVEPKTPKESNEHEASKSGPDKPSGKSIAKATPHKKRRAS